jgi:hypothetical protein
MPRFFQPEGVGSETYKSATGSEIKTGVVDLLAAQIHALLARDRSHSLVDLVFYFVSPLKAVGVQTENFGPANADVNVIEK